MRCAISRGELKSGSFISSLIPSLFIDIHIRIPGHLTGGLSPSPHHLFPFLQSKSPRDGDRQALSTRHPRSVPVLPRGRGGHARREAAGPAAPQSPPPAPSPHALFPPLRPSSAPAQQGTRHLPPRRIPAAAAEPRPPAQAPAALTGSGLSARHRPAALAGAGVGGDRRTVRAAPRGHTSPHGAAHRPPPSLPPSRDGGLSRRRGIPARSPPLPEAVPGSGGCGPAPTGGCVGVDTGRPAPAPPRGSRSWQSHRPPEPAGLHQTPRPRPPTSWKQARHPAARQWRRRRAGRGAQWPRPHPAAHPPPAGAVPIAAPPSSSSPTEGAARRDPLTPAARGASVT